jgi:hypothetical protein
MSMVLGGHDQEGIRQRVRGVADRHLAFLHRLQQRRLHLGRRAVDLVGQHQVGEDGALLGHELAPGLVVDHRADDIGRQEVGRELNALELHGQRIGQRLHGECLGQARHPLQEDVPPGQKADQDPLDHGLLADDDFPDLRVQLLDECRLFVHQLVDDPDVQRLPRSMIKIASSKNAQNARP